MAYDPYNESHSNGPKFFIILFLFCIGSFIIWFINHEDDPERKKIADYFDGITGQVSDIEVKMEGTNYHYFQLSIDQQEVYKALYNGCKNYESVISIKSIENSDCEKAIFAFRNDHPEFTWVHNTMYTSSTMQGKTSKISFTIEDEDRTKMELLEKKADEILRAAPQGDYEKVKYIYEYIVNTTDYDINAEDNQSAYSALINHVSVCGGYSSAFLYLCDRAGIYCGYVSGDIKNRGLHAWNFVKIKDKYYWVDVTWGDPTYENLLDKPEDIIYDFLCVKDEDILGERILSNNIEYSEYQPYMTFTYPTCTDNSLNYYVKSGTYFETYDRLRLYNAIVLHMRELGKKQFVLKFANKDAWDKAIADLFEKNYYWTNLVDALKKRKINVKNEVLLVEDLYHVIVYYE